MPTPPRSAAARLWQALAVALHLVVPAAAIAHLQHSSKIAAAQPPPIPTTDGHVQRALGDARGFGLRTQRRIFRLAGRKQSSTRQTRVPPVVPLPEGALLLLYDGAHGSNASRNLSDFGATDHNATKDSAAAAGNASGGLALGSGASRAGAAAAPPGGGAAAPHAHGTSANASGGGGDDGRQGLAMEVGELRTDLEAAVRQSHGLLFAPKRNSSNKSSGAWEDTVSEELGPEQEKGRIFGLPKIFWALVADVLAMGIFVLCIPWTLYIAKRRRAAASSSGS